MLSKQTTTPLLLSTALLAHLATAQECAGTTWSTNCCIGTLFGSSVAIPPASTFSMLPPESFTATNNFELPIPTQVYPTNAQSLTREDSPLGTGASDLSPEEQASLSRELDSLVSQAATDTAVFSILPISQAGDGPHALGTPSPQFMNRRQDETTISGTVEESEGGFWDPTGTLADMSLAPGVTCRGTVEPLEQSMTASSESAGESSVPPSSAPGGLEQTASPGVAAAMITGAPAALLGAGLGVVMGAL